MYYGMGVVMNFLLEDELEDVQPLHKNLACGTLSGMLYKSTLGIVPCLVGGVLGFSLIGGLTLLV